MPIKKQILKHLNSKDYSIANMSLKHIIKKTNLKDEDLLEILKQPNKLIVTEFFFLQPKFSRSNLITIEKFINENLTHKNKLFVSDLIEIAIDFNLNLDYKKCLLLLSKFKDDNHFVLMSSMEYLFSDFKTNFVSEIIDKFTLVMNNENIDVSARLKATFYLFRVTFKKTYLNKIEKLIRNDLYNREILKNLLQNDINSTNYFDGHNSIKSIINK